MLLRPSALGLLAFALLILILHLLRSRERRREVSALFLWEGIRGDPRSTAARIRQRIDLLLLLQLAALFALAVALAEPAWRRQVANLGGLVVVIDGSASMRGETPEGGVRYREALDRAIDLIVHQPARRTGVIQLSTRPAVLAAPGATSGEILDRLRRSEPTWYGDGSPDDLASILQSFGGGAAFDRIVLFTDRAWDDLPAEVEVESVSTGPNRAITRFSVREHPVEPGAVALVEIRNDFEDLQSVRVRIRDESTETALSLLLAPHETERVVIPFPGSRGTRFTATLEPADAFAADDVRYFALERPIELRVRWIGEPNRYLLAALRAVTPVLLVENDPDLTVVYSASAPAGSRGDLLLVHSDAPGIVRLGDERPATDPVTATTPGHRLLQGVDPSALRVREITELTEERPGTVILAAAGSPLLVEYPGPDRTVLLFTADLMRTNLPVTVDFPILIANWIGQLVRLPALEAHRWTHVGDPVTLAGRGVPLSFVGPDRDRSALPDDIVSVRFSEPGHYTLETDRGTFPIAVNVPTSESFVDDRPTDARRVAAAETVESLIDLRPIAAGAAIGLLLVEALAHWRRPRRRKRRTAA